MESAGVGVRLDRACVDGSLGEQVVICVCTVLAYGAYRASEVSASGRCVAAREMDESRNVRRTPYGFGVWCATAASKRHRMTLLRRTGLHLGSRTPVVVPSPRPRCPAGPRPRCAPRRPRRASAVARAAVEAARVAAARVAAPASSRASATNGGRELGRGFSSMPKGGSSRERRPIRLPPPYKASTAATALI